MTDFLPYPGADPAADDGPNPSDRYVVAVTCNLNEGLGALPPVSTPLTYEAART